MINWLLVLCIALGHLAIFVTWINRIHGTATPRSLLKVIDLLWYCCFLGLPVLAAVTYIRMLAREVPFDWQSDLGRAAIAYGAVCLVAAMIAVSHRFYRLAAVSEATGVLSNHTRVESVSHNVGQRPTGTTLATAMSYLPGNEILQLGLHDKSLHLPDLPPALHGLRITHLSDLHLTGQLTQSFYHEVVDQANAFDSELIVITGDILERRMCVPWIKNTLGRLTAPLGVFFVLGNHELRLKDERLARTTLTDAGLRDLGGHWVRIDRDGYPLVLAGNELPWFPPAADLNSCPEEFEGQSALRIAVCHTPDQLGWARANHCQLMLAGHTHGGQVRLPLVGPILAPSVFGTRHASGTFYHAPTLLHVSRGLAGTRPIRFRCRPEISRLVLQG